MDDDCLQELRWLYDRRDLTEARRDLAAWLAKWSGKYSKFTGWVEDNIDETLTFYRLPRQHHKHLKSTNMLERLNEEIRRRTQVCASSPMARAACGWCGHWRSRPTRTGSSSIATSTWTICASTRRRHCDVRPDPRPVQPSTVLALSRTLRAGSAGAAAFAAASLTAAARCSAGRQVGTKGWSFPIQQRDAAVVT